MTKEKLSRGMFGLIIFNGKLYFKMIFTSHYLVCHGVSHPLVELFALYDEEAVPGADDAALGGDGPGGVDIVPSHHPHGDTRALALLDGGRHLVTHWVLQSDTCQMQCETVRHVSDAVRQSDTCQMQ